jgi:hypothetical protein
MINASEWRQSCAFSGSFGKRHATQGKLRADQVVTALSNGHRRGKWPTMESTTNADDLAMRLPDLREFAAVGQDKAAVARLYAALLEDLDPQSRSVRPGAVGSGAKSAHRAVRRTSARERL